MENHELQLVCHCEFCHCDVEDEDAADGFPRGSLCSTAIQFSDRHSNRSFLLLRIVDLVVDVVDVLDVSVSEIVAFPPRERLAFQSIVLMQRENSGRRPLIFFLITASLSSKTCNIALGSECIVFGGM